MSKRLQNYRPIFVILVLSKVFEKVICVQVYRYFKHFTFFTSAKFDFREGLSTSHATLNNLQFVYDILDKRDLVLSVFLDFRKAFDRVDHKTLVSKLSMYEIRGVVLDWFRSYLSGRYQYVAMKDVLSEPRAVSYGVLQGSTPGPLLSLILINGFPNSEQCFQFTLFADDSTLTCCIPYESTDCLGTIIESELLMVSC